MHAPDLARAVGFKQSSDWRFGDLLRSANQYGLVSGAGATALISLEPLGQDIVAPSSPNQRSDALLAAFRSVNDFAQVENFYKGKRIPEDEFFLNTVTREFHITRDRVDTFARIFLENLRYLRAFAPSTISETGPAEISSEIQQTTTRPEKIPSPVVANEPRVREFLDTCFVMMLSAHGSIDTIKKYMYPRLKRRGLSPSEPMSSSRPVASSSKFGIKSKNQKSYSQTYLKRMQTFSTN